MIGRVYAVVDISNSTVNPVAQYGTLSALLNIINPLTLLIGGAIFLYVLIYGSFIFLTSAGEPEKIQRAKKTITYAIVGLVFVMFASLFVNVLSYIVGVKSFTGK